MTTQRQTNDTLTGRDSGKPGAGIGAACRRLKEAVEVGAEALGQVIRGQGMKFPSRTRGETKKTAKLQKLLDGIRADAKNHGLRPIMASAAEVEIIRSLSETDIRQAETLLRELQAELSTIRAYAQERLRAIQAGQRGSDVTLIMLTIENFKTLDRAVENAVAKLPANDAEATAPTEDAMPEPQTGSTAGPSAQVTWRPQPARYRPPKDGWG